MSMLKFVMVGSKKKKRKKMTDEEINVKIREKLKVFRIREFRRHQKEIIFNLIKGKDCFVIFPTGYGKSLLYQLPALCLEGVAIIISPLISLMVDQVASLRQKGIKARTWNSQVRVKELRELKEDLMSLRPKTRILFTTPESLLSDKMRSPLNLLKRRDLITLFAIDEAHCISQWGFDFRPKYRSSLASLKLKYPKVPIIALTATATNMVKKDVLETLNLNDPKLFVSSFNRPEIRYTVKYKSLTPNGHMWDIVRFIKNERPNDFGIIYCRTIRRVEELCQYLRNQGVEHVEMYHGKMKRKLRNEISDLWKNGGVRVLVATIAFGMGVDKADIRYVIHETVPQSIEAFYQESGRAGRDRAASESILYYSTNDKDDIMYLINNDKRTNDQRKSVLRSKFSDMCKLCETAVCRRSMIVQYFGDQSLVQCSGTCDFCRNPKGVLDNIRRAVMVVTRKVVWKSQKPQEDDDWSRELNVVYESSDNNNNHGNKNEDYELLAPLTRRRRFEDREVGEIRRRVTIRKHTRNVHITDDQSLEKILDNLEVDENKGGGRNKPFRRRFKPVVGSNNGNFQTHAPSRRNRITKKSSLNVQSRSFSRNNNNNNNNNNNMSNNMMNRMRTKKKKKIRSKKSKQSILSRGRRSSGNRKVEVGKKRKRPENRNMGGGGGFVSARRVMIDLTQDDDDDDGESRVKKKRKLD